MMKKKMHDQEESKETNDNKTTENKENTYNSPESEKPEVQNNQNSGNNGGLDTEGSGESDSSSDKVVLEVKAVEEKLAEMQDKYLRLSAEFDNYRKRTLREKMDMTKYAGENLLIKIIPIMDDFERALAHMETGTDCSAMKSGIDLIYSKFSDFLRQNGIKEIDSMNCDFNVDLHEAVAKVPVNEDDMKGKVVDVVLKGYYLQDKVLRFSKVVVGE